MKVQNIHQAEHIPLFNDEYCAKNECLFCKPEELAIVGDGSHPLFLKIEQLCLLGESSKMCLISQLSPPQRGKSVCYLCTHGGRGDPYEVFLSLKGHMFTV